MKIETGIQNTFSGVRGEAERENFFFNRVYNRSHMQCFDAIYISLSPCRGFSKMVLVGVALLWGSSRNQYDNPSTMNRVH